MHLISKRPVGKHPHFLALGQQVYQSPERTFRWAGANVGALYYLVTFTDGRRFKGWLEVKP